MPIHWRAPIVDYSQNYNEILEHDWFPPLMSSHVYIAVAATLCWVSMAFSYGPPLVLIVHLNRNYSNKTKNYLSGKIQYILVSRNQC